MGGQYSQERDGRVSSYRLSKWIRSIRVVFSIDLIRTLVFGVMGELASLSGLKPRTVFIIRLDVLGRLRTRMDRQFNVASTRRASLLGGRSARHHQWEHIITDLLLSWSTASILSKRPAASASSRR